LRATVVLGRGVRLLADRVLARCGTDRSGAGWAGDTSGAARYGVGTGEGL